MADHFQTGVRSVARGDLLVATPQLTSMPWRRSVVFVTESSDRSVMGTILNRPTMMTTEDVTDCAVPRTQLYMGGPVSTQALFMLHTNDFDSTNTLAINSSWRVSSDDLMFEKLAQGEQPAWYKFFVGCAGWHPRQLEHEIAQGAWLTVKNPSYTTITQDPSDIWQHAVDAYSQNVFSAYI